LREAATERQYDHGGTEKCFGNKSKPRATPNLRTLRTAGEQKRVKKSSEKVHRKKES
jgi:hypothetical protein